MEDIKGCFKENTLRPDFYYKLRLESKGITKYKNENNSI